MRFRLLIGALGLLACGDGEEGPKKEPADAGLDAAAPSTMRDAGRADAALDAGVAPLVWTACGDAGYQCATMPVGADALQVALSKLPASGTRVGSLVWNPGGPGESALDYQPALVQLLSDEVLAHYDLIALDPRGVGHSDPIVCHSKLQQLYAIDPTPDSEQEWQALDAISKEFADECASKYPLARLAELGTTQVAADLELLRQRLGEPKLNFLGFSYGTALAAYYLARYPERAGKFVLDGVVDLALSPLENARQQAQGFERALHNYFAWCSNARCPWANGDPAQAFAALLAQVEAAPLPSPHADRACGPGELLQGVATFLYAGEEGWRVISKDLLLATQGDGSELVIDTDIYLERDDASGEYSNITEANYAVSCIDDEPLTVAQIRAEEASFRAAAPIFGVPVLSRLLVCAHWTATGTKPPVPASVASAPFLVLGTTQDPATPYAWAQATASRLGPSARLFTYRGEGHTAYAREVPCVDAVVDRYLLDGTLPAPGGSCGDEAALRHGAPVHALGARAGKTATRISWR